MSVTIQWKCVGALSSGGHKMKWLNNFLCRHFGHRWPYLIDILQHMAMMEIRGGFVTNGVKARCRRCGAIRNLTQEILDEMERRKNDEEDVHSDSAC